MRYRMIIFKITVENEIFGQSSKNQVESQVLHAEMWYKFIAMRDI